MPWVHCAAAPAGAWLGARLVAQHAPALSRRVAAWTCFMLPVALSVWVWARFFFPSR